MHILSDSQFPVAYLGDEKWRGDTNPHVCETFESAGASAPAVPFSYALGSNTNLTTITFYSFEAKFVQSLLSTGRKQLASRFNFTYRYTDDVLSINNPEFENYLGKMYPVELEIKDTTESNTSASYLDLLLSIGRDGQLHTSIYDKRDDFNFHKSQIFRS